MYTLKQQLLPLALLVLLVPAPLFAQSQILQTGQDHTGQALQPSSHAAPAAPAGTASARQTLEDMIFRYEPVNFEFDSSALTPVARRILDRKAKYIAARSPAATIRIEGYCDATGSSEYNLHLGALRAAAVQAYLTDKWKIKPQRLKTISYGEQKPLTDEFDEAAQAKNRRVELKAR